jgi:hypothetical protein
MMVLPNSRYTEQRGAVTLRRSHVGRGRCRRERDSIGETALFGAAASGHVEVARFLLDAGADRNPRIPGTSVGVKIGGSASKNDPAPWGDVLVAFDKETAKTGGLLFIDEMQDLARPEARGEDFTPEHQPELAAACL